MPQLLGQPALQLRSIEGTEGLSQLFNYKLLLATPDDDRLSAGPAANVDFKVLVGQDINVNIELEGKGAAMGKGQGAGTRQINGICTRARFVRLENRRGIYELIIEPWLTLATRQSNHRMFQDMNVVQIIQSILGGGQSGPGYPYPLLNHTSGMDGAPYPAKDCVVQYAETDFDFISRLMQEWGIYYYFAHQDGKHQMVLVDAPGAHQPNPSAAYQQVNYFPPGHKINEEYINSIDFSETLQSGVYITSEFDFKKPNGNFEQKSKLPRHTAHNQLEHYIWPNNSHNPEADTDSAEGKHLTQVKLQALGCLGQRATAAGNLRAMVPGYTFNLGGYPNTSYNDKDYLIVSSHLLIEDVGASSSEGQYKVDCQLQIQPIQHSYRAEQCTPRPRTSGPQTAIVAGPEGREIYTDSYGRVKLRFHWDRYGSKDENASPWVRVNYPAAGTGFGGISIPRIGQEVIVDFEHGRPDMPIVTGRVYNAMNMPPWELPGNATQSGVLTRSSEGANSSNANAMRFEDKKGQEEVWLHAEKDQRIEVENNESHSVGVDRSKSIGNDETVSVGHDRTETVGNDEKISIGVNRNEDVGKDENISIGKNQGVTVGANQTFTVADNRTKSVGKNEKDKIGKNWSISVGKFKTETIAMASMQNVGLGKMVNVGAAYSLTVGGMMMTNVGMNSMTTVGGSSSTTVTNNTNIKTGKALHITAGDEYVLTVGESVLTLKKDGTVVLKCKKFQVDAPDNVNIKSTKIDLN
jgi:type VI secretion system secreted protein VgrG